ncbi:MAG: DNA topoisomerase [Desulfobacteraceae bacterium]|jgi:hypothetical protein|nr:DNA topoisomerase [Desulfobacteraceae bacterium]
MIGSGMREGPDRIADWLVGMNGSRAATIRLKDLFSIGRVQTAVLALLVERRKARDDFTPQPYWLVKATFRGEKGTWQGLWVHEGKSRLTSREEAQKIVDAIENRQGVVTSSKKTKKSQPPPLLYSLTDLQQDANFRFGFSATAIGLLFALCRFNLRRSILWSVNFICFTFLCDSYVYGSYYSLFSVFTIKLSVIQRFFRLFI